MSQPHGDKSYMEPPRQHSFQAGIWWIHILSLAMLVVGAINLGVMGLCKLNAIAWVSTHTHPLVEPIVYILIGISGLLHVFTRDYYLSFLGPSAFPCGPLMAKTPSGANAAVTVKVAPHANVVYWASNSDMTYTTSPVQAYGMYTNAGVARSDSHGMVTLRIRKPSSYTVPFVGRLKPHVHYRVCRSNGLLDRVETVELVDAITSL